jgi:hypothetical protein
VLQGLAHGRIFTIGTASKALAQAVRRRLAQRRIKLDRPNWPVLCIRNLTLPMHARQAGAHEPRRRLPGSITGAAHSAGFDGLPARAGLEPLRSPASPAGQPLGVRATIRHGTGVFSSRW